MKEVTLPEMQAAVRREHAAFMLQAAPSPSPAAARLARLAAAEAVGTTLLLAIVVGSGIMAERLANGNIALALLANALATGAALIAIILALQSISGPHLHPGAP